MTAAANGADIGRRLRLSSFARVTARSAAQQASHPPRVSRSSRLRDEKQRVCLVSALIERQKRLRILWADVVGARADQAVVGVLFEAVRRPAGDAADGKNRGVEVDLDAER